MSLKTILELVRAKQYIKNTFVFIPAIFAGTFFSQNSINLLWLFLIFSAAASSIYIFNDLIDVNEDKKDVKKSQRPIPAGLISVTTAKIVALFLAVTAITAGYCLSVFAGSIIVVYILLNTAYTLKLKHMAIYDIVTVALGFVLRVAAGGAVANVYTSAWLYAIAFTSTLFLAASKRRKDVLNLQNGHVTRKVAGEYDNTIINSIMMIAATSTIVSYLIYSIEKSEQHQYFFVTSFFVIVGLLKYLQMALKNQCGDDPSYDAINNKNILILMILWATSIIIVTNVI